MTTKSVTDRIGVNLNDVAKNANYTSRALRGMFKSNPGRLELLCKGQLMSDLGVDCQEIKELKVLADKIRGGA